MALFPGLPGWAGTRKVKPIWILLKQETVSSSGISWAICKSAPRSRQITMPTPHHSVFYRPDALLAAQPTASMHWRDEVNTCRYNWLCGSVVTKARQEAQLSPSNRAMRLVSSNLANCHATVQKLLIRQVLTKLMVWSWRFSQRQCVMNNVHSTMTRPRRLPLSQVS